MIFFQNVTIRANVSDDSNVSAVYANVTLPNGSIRNVSMTRLENNVTFEGNFTSVFLPGPYNVRIIANDTSGNVNSTETTLFFGSDNLAPNITLLLPQSSSTINRSYNVTIRANVTDDVNVSSVTVNVTLPNGTVLALSMDQLPSLPTYEVNFTQTSLSGLYSLRIIARDTSNNTNLSVVGSFSVNDFTPPNVTIVAPSPGAHYNASQNVTVWANVTDDFNVSVVLANITLPDSSVQALTMIRLANNVTYEANFSGAIPGTYVLRIVANDTLNNVNASQNLTFFVDDSIQPNVTIASPLNASTFNVTNNVTIHAEVRDDVAVSTVFANVTLPNSSLRSYQMVLLPDGITYEANLTETAKRGVYSIRIIANDSSSNVNSSQIVYVEFFDLVAPRVLNVSPIGQNFTFNSSVRINATVFDNNNVSTVFANITLPNGSLRSASLLEVSGGLYSGLFTETQVVGRYNFYYCCQ